MELQTKAPTAGPKMNSHSKPANDSLLMDGPWHIVFLLVSSTGPNPFQPRSIFNETEMQELTNSVRTHGVLQPVMVRTSRTDERQRGKSARKAVPTYHLIAGERRLRACRKAGRKTIPAIVRDDLSDVQAAELSLVENVQRANLSVIDEAAGYRRLMLDFRLKEERIAKKVGKSVQTIRDVLRLLALPVGVQTLLSTKKLSASHGHELLRLAAHPTICESVALRCVRDKTTATALAANLLPNASELKRSGAIMELGFMTKFDWKRVCKECPYKALVSSGYSSYCLRPDEWHAKQTAAIEMQQQEATRVLEAARAQNEGTVEVEKLAPGSYRRLLHVQVPAGCSERCVCRSEACDPGNGTQRNPVCLNPQRFEELREVERKANEEVRARRYTQDWQDAATKLKAEDGLALTASLLVWPLVRAQYRSYVLPDAWRTFVQNIAAHLEVELPWEQIFEPSTEVQEGLKQLRAVEAQPLLRLGAALMLGQEAQGAVRFAGVTPLLDWVLGRAMPQQRVFEPGDEEGDDPFVDEYDDYDGDYPDELEE